MSPGVFVNGFFKILSLFLFLRGNGLPLPQQLLYNCSGEEFSKLKQIFAMLRLRMRVVEPDRYHVCLDELARGEGEAGETAPPLPEPMLVFCYLPQALLNQVLETY